MLRQLRLFLEPLLMLLILSGCQVSNGDSPLGDGVIIVDHAPAENMFTLTTTLNRTYTTAEVISFYLKFPKAVTVTLGIPSISITIGPSSRTIPMTSGDGTDTLVFSYTVQNGDGDLDGISVGASLNKNGSDIKYDSIYDASTVIDIPNLSTVRVVTSTDTAPVTANINPPAFNEDVQSYITLSYTDSDSDLAVSCNTFSPINVTITQACACSLGICIVGVRGALNYNGIGGFSYRVTANGRVSNASTASLNILPIDDAPVTSNIAPVAFNSNTQSIITLSYTDTESHQAINCSISALSNITVTRACTCAAGVCTVGVTGNLNYIGAAGFNYTVTANTLISNSSISSLTINPLPSAPIASNITPPTFNEDTESSITLSYTDTNSDQATFCSIAGLNNIVESTPCACSIGVCTVGVTGITNHNGIAGFTFTVTAAGDVSNSANASLTISPVDDAPVSFNIIPSAFNEDTQSIITLSYFDVDLDSASSCVVSSLSNVTITQSCVCASGICTVGVTGLTDYSGTAGFNYTVTTTSLTSNTSSAVLNIIPISEAPVALDINPVAFNENTQSIITLDYTDADSDAASNCSVFSLSNVTITQSCICTSGTCTVGVTGDNNYSGTASFAYTITANSQVSNTAVATLSITPVTNVPVAANITPPAFDEDVISVITLLYTDGDGDFASACNISNLSNITIAAGCSCVLGTCTVGVRGNLNYNGTASFDYTVTANSDTSNTATASLTIGPIEDAAIASNTTPPSFNEDTQSVVTLTHTDPDSQSTICTISSLVNVTVTQSCACTSGICTVGVTGTPNYNGPASFSFTVRSNSLTSNTANASLSITPVVDAPTISAITAKVGNANVPTSAISFSLTDPDQTLSCTGTHLSMTSSNQSLVVNSSVTWAGTYPNCTGTITPVNGMIGATTITFTVNDGTGGTAASSFSLTVNGVILVWTSDVGAVISSYDFGTPATNATRQVYVKNNGNATSSAITITDGGLNSRIQHTTGCTTLTVGSSCLVSLVWTESGGPSGARTETFTATANGSAPVLNVTGFK